MLAKIAARGAGSQSEADYGVPKGLTLRDEIARYFRIGAALFQDFAASPTPSAGATIAFAEALLGQVLGFSDLRFLRQKDASSGVTLEAKQGRVPIVVVPPGYDQRRDEERDHDLDRASPYLTSEGRRRSAASALQDWLNHNDQAQWGLCTNGERLRLMRDNASLTRPAYVEANLRQIFDGENFADFAALWLLLHATRFGVPLSAPTDSHLERWREAGAKEGVVARDRLRLGVEDALRTLGTGFLAHPENSILLKRVASDELPISIFFGQLLRLVYRLIFLMVAEDRSLLHPPDAPISARKLYAEGYSMALLRERAIRRTAWDRHHDRWEGLLIAFQGLAQGQAKLGLPALGGLFDNVIPDLQRVRLSNRALMEAVYRLAWMKDEGSLVPVNWEGMETEELGSVYEGLLELTPILAEHGRAMGFAAGDETKGNARKSSGSYYTPDSLVQTLLDSALDPVLDRVESESADRVQGLLSVTVIDPACGSGHFLLAAARRLATRVARARTGGVASAADYRHALRDVVRNCIHGVDRNPMAVELTKVALWIETVEPGKPLGFLDANVLCGDALLGVFDLAVLREGIPDAAYKPLSGDDKVAAKDFDRRNKDEKGGQGRFAATGGRDTIPTAPPLAASLRAVRTLPEDSTDQIAEKRRRLEAARTDRQLVKWRAAADLYVAAFLLAKKDVPRDRGAALVPTTDHVFGVLAGHQIYGLLVQAVQEVVDVSRMFHWPLEFPDVMAAGGFDVVIGNPPWERIKLQEQEFFAAREPEIAMAPTASVRGKMIAALRESDGVRERRLYFEFETAKRIADASSVFARESGRFPLTGRGDVNTYALFAELATLLQKEAGRAGVIVPTGIATDSTTAAFFGDLIERRRLIRLVDFENREGLFPAVDSRMKFCIITTGRANDPEFAFFLVRTSQLSDSRRGFTLSAAAIARINPNTGSAPIFRSRADADLTRKIYSRVPVFLREDHTPHVNLWHATFHSRIWHMAEDSQWFRTAEQLSGEGYTQRGQNWIGSDGGLKYVPLLEAKMIHQFDHRWSSYRGQDSVDVDVDDKADSQFEPSSRYWVPEGEVLERLGATHWEHKWLVGWRDITNATNERTVIATATPAAGTGDTLLLVFPGVGGARLAACLLANFCSIVLDYCARQKVGGTHLKFNVFKQLPVHPPAAYDHATVEWLATRVLELTYTSHSMTPFARDLGYEGSPFPWDEARRALLRAELDAWYARAYGLTRDELRYILDPADVMGADYPSETFRVLKNNETKKFGEYRTRRLVLEAWDRMEAGDLR